MNYQFEWKPNINFPQPQFQKMNYCFLCPCYGGEVGCCNLSERELTAEEENGEKLSWCPLVEVKPEEPCEWIGFTASHFTGVKNFYQDHKYYRCSNCRKGSAIKSKFCPNCGGALKGE